MHTSRQSETSLRIGFVGNPAYQSELLGRALQDRGHSIDIPDEYNHLSISRNSKKNTLFSRAVRKIKRETTLINLLSPQYDVEVRAFSKSILKANHSVMTYHGTDIRDGLWPAEYPCFFTTWDLRKYLSKEMFDDNKAVWIPRVVREELFYPKERLPFDGRHITIGHFPSDPKMDEKYLGKGTPKFMAAVQVLRDKGYVVELVTPTTSGRQRQEDMAGFYHKCHVIADQFTVGQYGITTLESILCNRPTVCYVPDDHLEFPAMADQFMNCSQDPESIATALVDAINLELNPDIVRRLYSAKNSAEIFERALREWGCYD